MLVLPNDLARREGWQLPLLDRTSSRREGWQLTLLDQTSTSDVSIDYFDYWTIHVYMGDEIIDHLRHPVR